MNLDLSVAVFCQNEAARVRPCIASIAVASSGLRVALTVITNGSTDGSAALALDEAGRRGLTARAYAIAVGDKANAINHSFGGLRQTAGLHAFVDGYAVIGPDSFAGMRAALARDARAVAFTGVACNGRTMAAVTDETLAHGGRLHGQLHAFRPEFIDRLVGAGFGLPIGLYRGDGLLGSMACHDLDPLATPWDGHRIHGVASATYEIPRLDPLRPSHVARQFRRTVRQMRGRLENSAIKATIYEGKGEGGGGFGALPLFADDMIAAWLARGGQPEAGPLDWPFMALALRHHRAFARPDAASLQPVFLGES